MGERGTWTAGPRQAALSEGAKSGWLADTVRKPCGSREDALEQGVLICLDIEAFAVVCRPEGWIGPRGEVAKCQVAIRGDQLCR